MERISVTAHGRARMQQRGISELQVRLIKNYGVTRYQKGGDELSFIPERMLIELRDALDKLKDVSVVLGEDNRVVTAMHKTRRIHVTDYAA